MASGGPGCLKTTVRSWCRLARQACTVLEAEWRLQWRASTGPCMHTLRSTTRRVAMAMLRLDRGFATVIGVLVVTRFLVPLPVAAAPDSGIPNLLGQWSVAGQGAVLCKVQASRCKTHHHGDYGDLKATVKITKQQGRLVHGVYMSKYASENCVAAIGYDNKSFYLVDEDGFADGRLLDAGRMQVVYRHVSSLDSVIDISTWLRR